MFLKVKVPNCKINANKSNKIPIFLAKAMSKLFLKCHSKIFNPPLTPQSGWSSLFGGATSLSSPVE